MATNAAPMLRSFTNATTTVSYGHVLAWDTTSIAGLDWAGNDTPFMFGGYATVCALTTLRPFPAGIVWGPYGTSTGLSTDVVGSSAEGFLVVRGVHPAAHCSAAVTIGNIVIPDISTKGALVATASSWVMNFQPVGRALHTTTTVGASSGPVWVNLG